MSTAPAAPTRSEEIRDAALTLFSERGYHGTSMKDIAAVLGIRAPSLYNHLASKQELLVEVTAATMRTLLADHAAALATSDDVAEQLRAATETHVRYHARHPREVRIGNRDISALEPKAQRKVLRLRREYADAWRALLERGVAEGRFALAEPRLTAYAILEMGIGVTTWFKPDGPLSEAVVAYHYGDMALRLAGVAGGEGGVMAPPTPARRGRVKKSG